MKKGYNIFNEMYHSNELASKPCVFLSHKSEDKEYVKAIGEYIKNAGINIYLDVNDVELQKAAKAYDSKKITECIERGISLSSHMLCIVSDNTVKSWWVPYELGYGKKSQLPLATLKSKGKENIPDYLKVEKVIESKDGINDWLISILRSTQVLFSESTMYKSINSNDARIEKTSAYQTHSLDKYLK